MANWIEQGLTLDDIIKAAENCLDTPKCRDCPWADCEDFDHGKVEVPRSLLLALRSIAYAVKDRAVPRRFPPRVKPDAVGVRYECWYCGNLMWVQRDTASMKYNMEHHRFCSYCGQAVEYEQDK